MYFQANGWETNNANLTNDVGYLDFGEKNSTRYIGDDVDVDLEWVLNATWAADMTNFTIG